MIQLEIQPVSRNTLALIDPRLRSNAGAILFDDFIVVVDATLRPDAAGVFRTLLQDTYRRPVRYLCLTHHHSDHIFGLKPFKDVTLFAAHPFAANLQRRASSDWTPEALAALKAEDPLANAWIDEVELILPPVLFHQRLDIVHHQRRVEFHHSGGHTDCSVYAYDPGERTLFAGDLIFSGRLPYAGDPTCDPERWMAALRGWLDLEIEHVVPGHGPLADKGEIEKQLAFLEQLKDATLHAIRAGQAPQAIQMPALYPVDERSQWFVEPTQARWHAYYLQHSGG